MILPFQISFKKLLIELFGRSVGWIPYDLPQELSYYYVVDVAGIAIWSLIVFLFGVIFTLALHKQRDVKDHELEGTS